MCYDHRTSIIFSWIHVGVLLGFDSMQVKSPVSVPCKSEREVFEKLGFPWLEPHERNLWPSCFCWQCPFFPSHNWSYIAIWYYLFFSNTASRSQWIWYFEETMTLSRTMTRKELANFHVVSHVKDVDLKEVATWLLSINVCKLSSIFEYCLANFTTGSLYLWHCSGW
jgi:hypothetical protein